MAHERDEVMLTCIPLSLCSWDYQITDAVGGTGAVKFDFMGEEGSISLGTATHLVRKHGWLSGHWSLDQGGEVALDAHKPSAFAQCFELTGNGLNLTVKSQSGFTRSFDIVRGDTTVGTIYPAHAFTKRAFVECDPSVPELVQLFSFWLAVLMWKRDADNS